MGYEGPVINYGEGGGLKNGRGAVKFYPYTKKGARKSFSHAEGGHNTFSDRFNTGA